MDNPTLVSTTMVSKANAKKVLELPEVKDVTLKGDNEHVKIGVFDRYGSQILVYSFFGSMTIFFKGLHYFFRVTEGGPKGFSDGKGNRNKGERGRCVV